MAIIKTNETGNETMSDKNRRIAKNRVWNDSGFTLIEVIVSLILIGVMMAIAGMGLVIVTRGYVFSKQNTETLLKSQVALSRISKELGSISPDATGVITSATNVSMVYTNGVAGVSRTISRTGNLLQIDGATLLDNVTAFTLTYFDTAGTNLNIGASSPSQTTLDRIRRTDIDMKVMGADNIESRLINRVKIQESNW